MALFHNFDVSLTHGVFSLVIVITSQVGEFAVNFAILRPYILRVGSEV